MSTRRDFLRAASGTLLLAAVGARAESPRQDRTFHDEIALLERGSGGRLGISLLDTGSGDRFDWRGDERFPMCSTFKFMLVAAVLRRADHGAESLDRRIVFSAADLVSYSPVTEGLVGPSGASILQLCEAAMTRSDNTAANLLLPTIGNPPGLTRFARDLGDGSTRLDRNETSLNTAIAGDPRDTTTPRAMVDNLNALLLGKVLSATSREQLTRWLIGNRTGDMRLRAGLPPDWRIGDKTGSGMNGTTNDIAILWPPGRAPLLLASYLTGSPLDSAGRDLTHKHVALAVAKQKTAR